MQLPSAGRRWAPPTCAYVPRGHWATQTVSAVPEQGVSWYWPAHGVHAWQVDPLTKFQYSMSLVKTRQGRTSSVGGDVSVYCASVMRRLPSSPRRRRAPLRIDSTSPSGRVNGRTSWLLGEVVFHVKRKRADGDDAAASHPHHSNNNNTTFIMIASSRRSGGRRLFKATAARTAPVSRRPQRRW